MDSNALGLACCQSLLRNSDVGHFKGGLTVGDWHACWSPEVLEIILQVFMRAVATRCVKSAELLKISCPDWCHQIADEHPQKTVEHIKQSGPDAVRKWLSTADIAIDSIQLKSYPGFLQQIQLDTVTGQLRNSREEQELLMPTFSHATKDGSAVFEFHDESEGTQKAIATNTNKAQSSDVPPDNGRSEDKPAPPDGLQAAVQMALNRLLPYNNWVIGA